MIQFVVVAGLAWLLLRDSTPSEDGGSDDSKDGGSGGSTYTDPNEDSDGNCKTGFKRNSEGACMPFIDQPTLNPTASWSIKYQIPEIAATVVWQLDAEDQQHIPDGSYFVIGNLNHSAFNSSSSESGSIDIPSSVSGGDWDRDNVVVYSDLAAASAHLDSMAPEGDGDGSGSGGGFGGFPPLIGQGMGQNGPSM